MKSGRQLAEVLTAVKEAEATKRDWVVDTRGLALVPRENAVGLHVDGVDDLLTPTRHFHGQVAGRIKVPSVYYNRMAAEAPALLAANVNHWFHAQPQRRMVRGLGSNARAFLSDRYRPFDNWALARAVLPLLGDMGTEVRFASCEVTENRLYLKAVFPRIQGEIRKGDIVQSGIVVTNSEIGLGQTECSPLMLRCICNNGLIVEQMGSSRRHVGRVLGRGNGDGEDDGEAYELFRDETLRLDEAAYVEKLRDVVRATVDETKFRRIIEKSQEAAADRSELKPVELVKDITARSAALQDGDSDALLQHLIEGGDLSRWGMINAITRLSQDVEDYDRATELEQLGGRLLERGWTLN